MSEHSTFGRFGRLTRDKKGTKEKALFGLYVLIIISTIGMFIWGYVEDYQYRDPCKVILSLGIVTITAFAISGMMNIIPSTHDYSFILMNLAFLLSIATFIVASFSKHEEQSNYEDDPTRNTFLSIYFPIFLVAQVGMMGLSQWLL